MCVYITFVISHFRYINEKLMTNSFFTEREWRRQKSEYESYIMALEAERDARSRQGLQQQVNT